MITVARVDSKEEVATGRQVFGEAMAVLRRVVNPKAREWDDGRLLVEAQHRFHDGKSPLIRRTEDRRERALLRWLADLVGDAPWSPVDPDDSRKGHVLDMPLLLRVLDTQRVTFQPEYHWYSRLCIGVVVARWRRAERERASRMETALNILRPILPASRRQAASALMVVGWSQAKAYRILESMERAGIIRLDGRGRISL